MSATAVADPRDSATAAIRLASQPVPRELVLPADPEVRGIGRAVQPAGGDRRADRDADPDLAELAPQDVLPVAGRAHPGALDLGRGGEAAGAPGDVLAQRPALPARIAGAEDAVRHVGARWRLVREEPLRDHVARVPLRGLAQL